MIRPLLSLLLLGFLPAAASAQTAPEQGVIVYDQALNFREQIAKENPALASFLPEQLHMALEVPFRGDAFAIVIKEAQAPVGGAARQAITVAGPDNQKVFDLKRRLERSEIQRGTRRYYAEKPFPAAPAVRLVREQRTILGYPCYKALVTTAEKELYTVWYTPALPHPYNPAGAEFTSLPGAVLEYSTTGQHCRATAIRKQAVPAASLAVTPAAKKISAEQLQDLQEDEAEERRNAVLPAGAPGGTKQPVQRIDIKL